MAQLLESGKIESARIRVENIIRSDITTELHEILELYCELLLARSGLLDTPVCDPGLEEAVQSIIYAAPKTEIKELQTIRALFAEKFGKEFAITAMENSDGKVSEKVVKKLSVTPPRDELVNGYLEEIARAYGVDWPPGRADLGAAPQADDDNDNDNPSGGQAEKVANSAIANDGEEKKADGLSKATPPQNIGPGSPLHINPPSPSTDNPRPKVTLNSMELKPNKKMVDAGIVKKKPARDDGIPGADELAARFAALKR